MKKTVLTLILFTVSLISYAQTTAPGFIEVKKVETRWEKYKNEDNKDMYGVSFKNLNTFPVTVEVEVWRHYSFNNNSSTANQLTNTKSFVLKENEEYLWKLEIGFYRAYMGGYVDSSIYRVQFKAYKSQ